MTDRTPTGDGRDVEWADGDGDDPSDPRSEWDRAFADAERGVPEEVPLHIAETIRELDTDTVLVLADWVDTLARRREIERKNAADAGTGDGEPEPGSVVEKYQRCGKDGCVCASGAQEDLHGPYEYRVTTDDEGNRQWEYLGKA